MSFCEASTYTKLLYYIDYVGTTLEITMEEYLVNEVDMSVTVCVSLTGQVERTVSSRIFTIGGTAEGILMA